MAIHTAELRKLLETMFTSSTALKTWTDELAESVHELEALVQQVHWEGSVADIAAELVDQLKSHGALKDSKTIADIRETLLERFPLHSKDIEAVLVPSKTPDCCHRPQ